ncbi:hypothetical protein VUR80DRAFT_1116 [Thermomyces stellatus]
MRLKAWWLRTACDTWSSSALWIARAPQLWEGFPITMDKGTFTQLQPRRHAIPAPFTRTPRPRMHFTPENLASRAGKGCGWYAPRFKDDADGLCSLIHRANETPETANSCTPSWPTSSSFAFKAQPLTLLFSPDRKVTRADEEAAGAQL